MNDITAVEDGLRERKRAALYSRIEQTAMDLVMEYGYEHVTVEMICEAAMISQRTFFNYFGSKEGVILGPTPPMPSTAEIDAFTQKRGGNVFSDFVALITTSIINQDPDPKLFRARRAVIMRNPDLLSRETARMAAMQDQGVQIILTRLRQQHGSAQPSDLEDEASMVFSLTTGVMQYAMHKWLASDAPLTARELFEGSTALIHRITKTNN